MPNAKEQNNVSIMCCETESETTINTGTSEKARLEEWIRVLLDEGMKGLKNAILFV
jgi:hypothetical protein